MTISAFVIRILLLAIPGILASKLYKKLRGRPTREAWESFIEITIFSLVSYAVVHLCGWDHSRATSSSLTVRATPPFAVQSASPVTFAGPPAYSISATQPATITAVHGTAPTPVVIEVNSPVTIASTQPISVDGTAATTLGPNQAVTIQPAGAQSASIFEAFLNDQVPIGGYVSTIANAVWVAMILALGGAYTHNYGLINGFGRLLRASKRSGDEDAWTYFNNSDDVQWVFVRDFPNNRVFYGSVKRFSDSEKPKEIVLNDVLVYQQDTDELLYCVDAVFLSRDHDDWTIEVPASKASDIEVPPAPANMGE